MIAPVLTYRVDDPFNVPNQLVLSGHDAAIPRMSLSLVSRSTGNSNEATTEGPLPVISSGRRSTLSRNPVARMVIG
ncbi:MAG: hypothetical protein DMF88_12770 [Acidobacteria bacterium]|nr:MAG: hypothetical protein DMF88_12770 [Acidobacteriota bacterium]